MADRLASDGKMYGAQPKSTTAQSSLFQPSARYVPSRPAKPMASTLMDSSTVNRTVNQSSSMFDHTSLMGPPPVGGETARKAEFTMITSSTVLSKTGCSQSQIAHSRTG